jgi:hypothetical protein
MKSSYSVLIALLFLFCASVVFAEDEMVMDGKTLKSLCAEYQETTLEGKVSKDSIQPFMRCLHYMQGVVNTSIFYERMMYTVSGNRLICFPRKTVSTDQAILLTNEYLRTHPEKLESQAVVLVMAALREAYPCNK